MGKKKTGSRLVKLDWDKECEIDFMLGRGFEITEPAHKGKDKVKSMYGIQSPIFCSDWGDEDAFADRYSCLCGDMKGKIFEGETCPKCHTTIKFKDVDLNITGWIIIKTQKIIQPIFYNKLSSIIGPKQFQDIITYDKTIDLNGNVQDKGTAANPFKGIGIVAFRERFNEILEYYKVKKKNKLEEIKEIEAEKDKVFASCIPVYSSVLRPTSFKGESFFYSTIDKKYNSIFSSVRLLNDTELFERRRKRWSKEKRERMDTPTILSSIQEKLMELYDLVFELVNQKEGHIKSEILGGMKL